MPVSLAIQNARTQIVGSLADDPETAQKIHEALRKALSYEVPGVDWSAKYKEGTWDGLISLYFKRNQSFPTGLVSRVAKLLEEKAVPFTVDDQRVRPERHIDVTTAFAEQGRSLHFYQSEAATRAIKAGRGIIALATGGGKTVTACEIIARAGVGPFLFIVPAISLLKQTKKEFERWLRVDGKEPHIGMVGDSVYDINPNGINVCTYQTILHSYSEVYKQSAGKDASTGAKWGANSVVVDPNAGEKVKKTTEELEAELKLAERALRRARGQAAPKLEARSDALQAARTDFAAALMNKTAADNALKAAERTLASAEGKAPQQKANAALKRAHIEFNKAERLVQRNDAALGAAARAYERDQATLTKGTTEAHAKAKKAYDDRMASDKKKADVRLLVEAAQGVIVDEAHLAAVVIETILGHAKNAYFKWGLTATPFREDNQEIRVEGAMGRKLIQISASDLIALGFLVPPNIFFAKIAHIEQSEDYPDSYEKHITRCWERNWRIKRFAEEFKAAGRPVLILVERIEHGQILEGMISGSVFVAGSDKGEDDPDDEEQDYRRRMLNQCEANEIILLGTSWAYTGVDAPQISTLILAGSCQSAVTTYQQVGRVIRTHAESGKTECVVIDFMDAEPKMRQHSLSRRKVYKGEAQFQVRTIG